MSKVQLYKSTRLCTLPPALQSRAPEYTSSSQCSRSQHRSQSSLPPSLCPVQSEVCGAGALHVVSAFIPGFPLTTTCLLSWYRVSYHSSIHYLKAEAKASLILKFQENVIFYWRGLIWSFCDMARATEVIKSILFSDDPVLHMEVSSVKIMILLMTLRMMIMTLWSD